MQFREGASNWVDTPFLQATTFEHEHEHEHERRTPNAKRLVRTRRALTLLIAGHGAAELVHQDPNIFRVIYGNRNQVNAPGGKCFL